MQVKACKDEKADSTRRLHFLDCDPINRLVSSVLQKKVTHLKLLREYIWKWLLVTCISSYSWQMIGSICQDLSLLEGTCETLGFEYFYFSESEIK